MTNAKLKSGAGPIVADRLKSFIERVEKLAEERRAIGQDIKDVFSEAKGVGYDVKTMRKVIALRAMDMADRAEQDALLDTYMHALGMIDRVEARLTAGEGIRAAARAEGVPRMTAQRVSQKREKAGIGTPHDPETGVIVEDAAPQTLGDASAPVAEPVHSSACPPQPLSEGGDGIGHQIEMGESNGRHRERCNRADERARGQGSADGRDPDGLPPGDGGETQGGDGKGEHQDRNRPNGDEVEPQVTLGAIAEPSAAQRVASPIDLTIPRFLDRRIPA